MLNHIKKDGFTPSFGIIEKYRQMQTFVCFLLVFLKINLKKIYLF